MPFRITPSLGPDVEQVGPLYFDAGQPGVSYELGSVVFGSDGGEYHFVQASANIAATANTGTQVVITFPANTAAAGTGGFYTKPGTAITEGQTFHVRRGAWNAVPA